jgi:hypothetical protein
MGPDQRLVSAESVVKGTRLSEIAAHIGPLRVLVVIFGLLSLPCVFLGEVDTPPWDVVVGQVMPGLVLFMIWALPFDMLMARVFMSDKPADRQFAYRWVIRVDLALWLLLLAFWGTFFAVLLTGRLT